MQDIHIEFKDITLIARAFIFGNDSNFPPPTRSAAVFPSSSTRTPSQGWRVRLRPPAAEAYTSRASDDRLRPQPSSVRPVPSVPLERRAE